MNTDVLDSLVKAANIGSSGVGGLAIIWAGYQLQKMPADATPIRHETLRSFFNLCTVITIVSATTGLLSAYFNRQQIVTERNRADAAVVVADTERQRAIAATTQIQTLTEKSVKLTEERKVLSEKLAAILQTRPEYFIYSPPAKDLDPEKGQKE